jgi:hypothetical protein
MQGQRPFVRIYKVPGEFTTRGNRQGGKPTVLIPRQLDLAGSEGGGRGGFY